MKTRPVDHSGNGRRRRSVRRAAPLWLLLILFAFVFWPRRVPEESTVVVDVLDGDSLIVRMDEEEATVRLFGIDCPEKGQPFSQRARAFTRSLALNQPATIRVMDTDRYGRSVCEVTLLDGRILNHELVSAGLAWWYRRHAPGDTDLAGLERSARDAKRGLWQDTDPEPPWDYRRRKTASLNVE